MNLRFPLVVEYIVKRSLALLLWVVWRARLNPFRYLRTMGYTTGRFYVEDFLRRHAAQCRGCFLEFGDPYYRHLFNPQAIERYDVFDVQAGPQVTIVGDIQSCPAIADNTYDVIVCTQVLEHIANPFLAVNELHRMLKPGGIILLTVPSSYPYHAAPRDYWRYTRDSLQLLFGERFSDIVITSYGNRLTVVAAYWFWMRDHLPRRALLTSDPDNATILTLYGRKRVV